MQIVVGMDDYCQLGCALAGADGAVERRYSGLSEVAESLEEGVILAVNIASDSDSTGAFTGNLLGARRDTTAITACRLVTLELRDVIEKVAQGLVLSRHTDSERPDTTLSGRYLVTL